MPPMMTPDEAWDVEGWTPDEDEVDEALEAEIEAEMGGLVPGTLYDRLYPQ